MQQKRFLFVINPISGDVDKSLLPQKIEIFSKRYSSVVDLIKTTGEDDVRRIREKCSEFQPDTLVACGGDGTVNMMAQIAHKSNLELGIIPGGSANGMATELGIPDDFDGALDFLGSTKSFSCDLLWVDDHLCLHLADVGLNAALIERFENSNQRGWWGYAREFAQQWKERFVVKYTISSKDIEKPLKIKGLVAVIANASVFGTGACINPEADLTDGKFEVIVMKPQGFLGFLGTTLRSFFGKINKSPFAKSISISEATIRLSEPQPLQVDGEFIYNTEKISIRAEKQALKLVGLQNRDNKLQFFE